MWFSNGLICQSWFSKETEPIGWKSHRRRSLVGCSPWGRYESDATERLRFHFSLSCIGEGNGKPLQYSCLENPRDGRACWAATYGVAQSQTWLKRLSSSSSSSRIYNESYYKQLAHDSYIGFLSGTVVKNLPANARDIRDVGSIPVLGRSPGERNNNPLQYSCLVNPMDRGAVRL